MAALSGPVVKRRRIELACTNCRQKKSRCGGQQPCCSSCLRARLSCEYQQAPEQRKPQQRSQDFSSEGRNTACAARPGVSEKEAELNSRNAPKAVLRSKGPTCQPPTVSNMLGHTPTSANVSFVEDLSRGASDEETMIDTLATAAFSHEPETDLGHFGPSSNHDYFRAVSSIFAHLARDKIASQPNNLNAWSRPQNVTTTTVQRPLQPSGIIDCMALPDEHTAMTLFNQFFTTIALTMPYLSRPAVMREYMNYKGEKSAHLDRVQRALFNMIWAHGSSSLDAIDPEVFYRRAVGLLDSLTIRGTSQEMVQLLLLVTSFQQNHQRSVTSWTFHALSVKAAFQLGLQSQASYESLSSESQQLRKRLWFGVLNQDRLLAAALGRPCLIPKQHARIEPPEDPKPTSMYLDAVSPDRIESLTYFRHIISINSIISDTLELLYDHNIDSTTSSIDNMVVRRLELQLQLESWRKSLSSNWKVLAESEFQAKVKTGFENSRFEMLLSIHYYRTLMLINRPVIVSILKTWIFGLDPIPEPVDEVILAVLRNDFAAAKELSRIIQIVENCGGRFLHRYGAWFLANYSVFTATIHLFSLLLACAKQPRLMSTMNIGHYDVRNSLKDSLATLQAVGHKSLMSQRGSTCFLRFLEVFDSLVGYQISTPEDDRVTDFNTASGVNTQSSPEFAMGSMSSYIVQAADDFLFNSGQDDFLWNNYGFLSQ